MMMVTLMTEMVLYDCRSPEYLVANTKNVDPNCFVKADSWSFGTLMLQVST